MALTLKRKCGDCTACCTVMKVDELDKDEQVRCEHLCTGGGCGIYSDRPRSCKTFECLWLEEQIHVRLKPHLFGVVLTLARTAFGQTVQMHEVWEGAGDLADVRELADRLRRYAPVIILRTDKTRTLLPGGQMMKEGGY